MPPPPHAVVRVAPQQRHTFIYHPSSDVNVPSLADARRMGFRMTRDELKLARKPNEATALVTTPRSAGFHLSRVGPATPFWLEQAEKAEKDRKYEERIQMFSGGADRKNREARRQEMLARQPSVHLPLFGAVRPPTAFAKLFG